MTSSACSTCGREVAVGIQQSVWFGRWIQWRLCCACFLAEEKRHARDREDAAKVAATKKKACLSGSHPRSA
jgi:hypothetical protein